jgi:hypothetical protein
MAMVPQKLVSPVHGGVRAGLPGLALVFLACGCVTMGGTVPDKAKEKPPCGTPCQAVATWQPHVLFAPDPVRMGLSAPGLTGRFYLFGGEQVDCTMVADGKLVVDLYDLSAGAAKQVLLEKWIFDKDTNKRLVRKDAIGWGFTLFLPWGTYRPDISMVQLKAHFEPEKGTPLYAEAAPLTLIHGQLPLIGGAPATTPGAVVPTPPTQGAVPPVPPAQPAAVPAQAPVPPIQPIPITGFAPRR